MPPAGPQSQQDSGLGPLWVVLAIFVAVIILWYFFHVPIIRGFLTLKLWELDVIDLFTSSQLPTRIAIVSVNPYDANMSELINIANRVGLYVAIPVGVILLVFAFLLQRKSIGLRYRHTYDMKSLLKAENVNWPQTTPVLGLDLVKQDINEGPWAMAKTPMQFAKINKLLREQKKPAEEGVLSREARVEVVVNRARATEIFVKQLGRPWTGVNNLNIYTRALFAVFAARINGDIGGARALLDHISASARNKQLDFSGVNALLEKHQKNALLEEVVSRHAFVLPVMASVLELARTVGVQASADFLWLKPIDRRLWYMLNSVGRQTPFVEVAGPFAHWLVEKKLGRKVVTPMIEEAIKALEEAIGSVIYKQGDE